MPARLAQEMMRHSDITLTRGRYTDAALLQTAACLADVPLGRQTPDS